MDKKDYIKSIEELNQEELNFIHSEEYKKAVFYKRMKDAKRNNYTLDDDNNSFSLYDYYYDRITNKINKIINKNASRDKVKSIIRDKEISPSLLDEVNKKKKVVYTCVIGKYDEIIDPVLLTDNTDYIIFTDKPKLCYVGDKYEVRPIPDHIRFMLKKDPILINRYMKMHPFELFKDYDYSLYIDGNIRVISDMDEVFAKSHNNVGLAMHIHYCRSDIYDEGIYCIKKNKGNRNAIMNTLKRYKDEGFPRGYGMREACIISTDLKNENAKNIYNEWWKEFLKNNTYRDQISLSYVLWKNNFLVEELGVLGTNVTNNPKFRKNQHINLK